MVTKSSSQDTRNQWKLFTNKRLLTTTLPLRNLLGKHRKIQRVNWTFRWKASGTELSARSKAQLGWVPGLYVVYERDCHNAVEKFYIINGCLVSFVSRNIKPDSTLTPRHKSLKIRNIKCNSALNMFNLKKKTLWGWEVESISIRGAPINQSVNLLAPFSFILVDWRSTDTNFKDQFYRLFVVLTTIV